MAAGIAAGGTVALAALAVITGRVFWVIVAAVILAILISLLARK